MKKLALALASATVLISAPALAADLGRMPVKAPVAYAPIAAYNWSGFYIGGFAGGAFTDQRNGTDVSVVETGGTGIFAGVPYNNFTPFGYDLNSSFIAGGTVGWNFQAPGSPFVFGLEGEAGYLHLRGSSAQPGSPNLDTVSSTRIGDWYGMIAGRLGFAWDRALIYAKGGGVFIDRSVRVLDNCVAAPCGGGAIDARGRSDDVTWAVGGGLEYALSQNWSLKAEYMYIDTRETLGACGVPTAGGGGGSTFCWSHQVPGLHTAKVGINYRFNWGAPVVASY